MRHPKDTGVLDAAGRPIFEGDRVRYVNDGKHTKQEYWNPEYVVVWDAPSFALRHVGGGKDGGSHEFRLKYGGRNGNLYLVGSDRHAYKPSMDPNDQGECLVCGKSAGTHAAPAGQQERAECDCDASDHCAEHGCRYRVDPPEATEAMFKSARRQRLIPGTVTNASADGPYTACYTSKDDLPYAYGLQGPGKGFGYYAWLLYPKNTFPSMEEAENVARLMNIAFREGQRARGSEIMALLQA